MSILDFIKPQMDAPTPSGAIIKEMQQPMPDVPMPIQVETPRPQVNDLIGKGEKADSTYNEINDYYDEIKALEGFDGVAVRKKKYNPRTGEYELEEHYTLGHGDYGPHIKEGDTITEEEAKPILIDNIKKRLPAVKNNIKKFDTFPLELRQAMVGSWFRGGLSGSPKTIGLINEGKFAEASKEFLRNDEYDDVVEEVKRAERLGIPTVKGGVKTRMENLARLLMEYEPTK